MRAGAWGDVETTTECSKAYRHSQSLLAMQCISTHSPSVSVPESIRKHHPHFRSSNLQSNRSTIHYPPASHYSSQSTLCNSRASHFLHEQTSQKSSPNSPPRGLFVAWPLGPLDPLRMAMAISLSGELVGGFRIINPPDGNPTIDLGSTGLRFPAGVPVVHSKAAVSSIPSTSVMFLTPPSPISTALLRVSGLHHGLRLLKVPALAT